MTAPQWIAIAAIALPALAVVLWPLLRRGAAGTATPPAAPPDRRIELTEEKASTYRALKELAFDHEAGSLSDDDFHALRERYEARAADLLAQLDALGGVPAASAAERAASASRPWTRSPAAIAVGGMALLGLGIALGVGLAGERFVAFDPELRIRRAIDRTFRRHGVKVVTVMEFDNIETIKQAIMIAAGESILPRHTVRKAAGIGTLAV